VVFGFAARRLAFWNSMPRTSSSRTRFAAAVLMLGTAAGLPCLPADLARPVRARVHDALYPGEALLHAGLAEGRGWWARLRNSDEAQERVAALEAELEGARLAHRQAQLQSALLRERLARVERAGISPAEGTPGSPLLVPELLEASVLGDGTRALWREGKLLDVGREEGVREMELVVDAARPLIDQGESNGIEPEQEVYAGRCVVGRIAAVGRWTSTVERVTDKHYRGLAQLARQTSRGLVFGAEGILEGDGSPTCRLREVPVTDSVEVGDDVYTGGRDGRLSSAMYYGKVVDVKLNEGATAWEIRVRPALDDRDLKTVQVLRTRLNPKRPLAH